MNIMSNYKKKCSYKITIALTSTPQTEEGLNEVYSLLDIIIG